MNALRQLYFLSLVLFFSCAETAQEEETMDWEFLDPISNSHYRGLYKANDATLWLSGTDGFVARSIDSGKTWEGDYIAGARGKDLRDIHGFDDQRAVVLSIADSARFFTTSLAGGRWDLVYENNREGIFFDGMDFWADGEGLAFGDPINGRMFLAKSKDYGLSWTDYFPVSIPESITTEGGFAASGTSILCIEDSIVLVGFGAVSDIRLFRSADRGANWEAISMPLKIGDSYGIYTMALNANGEVFATGGSFKEPEMMDSITAFSSDKGKTWQTLNTYPPSGYRSGLAFHPSLPLGIAVGTNGSDISIDGGKSWIRFSEHGFNSVVIGSDYAIAIGSRGKMARLDLNHWIASIKVR
jgi:photosystem II stability/assembly factor-like uncharacterized protein